MFALHCRFVHVSSVLRGLYMVYFVIVSGIICDVWFLFFLVVATVYVLYNLWVVLSTDYTNLLSVIRVLVVSELDRFIEQFQTA
jgi:hypothetical protein